MDSNQKECLYKIETAKLSIDNARLDLKKDVVDRRICNEVHTGVMWAVEAWLLKNAHKPDTGRSDKGIFFQFIDCAPRELRSKVSKCVSSSVILESPSEQPEKKGIIHLIQPPRLGSDKWKKKVEKCIKDAEEIISIIEKEFSKKI